MNIPIFIPSMSREKALLKEESWILNYPSDIYVVVSESQKSQYSEIVSKEKIFTHPNLLTGNMCKVRNYILAHSEKKYGMNNWISMIDDDVKQLELYENKEWKVFNTGKGISKILNLLLEKYKDGEIIGSNGVSNRFYKTLKPNTYGLVCADGFLIKLTGIRYDEDMDSKEDYYLSAKLLTENKKIYNLGNFNVVSKHYGNKGGVQAYPESRDDLNKRNQEYLLKKFPLLFKPKERKNSKYELSFTRKKNLNLSQKTLLDF